MRSRFLSLSTLFAASLIACLSANALADDAYRVEDTKGKHLDVLTPEGKPIMRYVYVREEGKEGRPTFDTAKVFAHVFADDGETMLTKGPGGKFPHHRGIFIGWKGIKHDGDRHDLWHVRNTEQRHEKFLKTDADAKGATVKSVIQWIGKPGKPVLEETRTLELIASDDAHALIDMTSELKAVNGPVELNGDPEHAGCQFRPSQKVAENKSAKYTFHAEGIDPKKVRDLPWVAETFTIDGQQWSVQLMRAPSNPEGARWSAYRDYGRFGPFAVAKIEDGQTLPLRYRFRVTKGPAPSRESMQKAYEAFVASL